MIRTEGRANPYFSRIIILVSVIASLCFSVGEGLRLRPFPVSEQTGVVATDTQFNSASSYDTSLRKYGPLDVPTRVQKRGKRQGLHHAHLPSANSRGLASRPVMLFVAGEPIVGVSLHLESSSPGRAPPSV